jgi:asparagine N-glycosylation enzyme membrane subunit Stt3
MMERMRETGRPPRTVGVAIAAGLVLLVALLLVGPTLFLGTSPSPFGLLLGAGSLVGAGLLVRLQGTRGPRAVGTILIVVGLVSLVLVVGLFGIALAGWGRPY